MAALPAARCTRPCLSSASPDPVFHFLAPRVPIARFSTSPALQKRDNNRNRGVSFLRSTGLRKRQALSVQRFVKLKDLPKPVEVTERPRGTENHGLYEFFWNKKLLRPPVSLGNHGRAWTVPELRKRNFPDLHALWWTCVKERNRLATEKIERKRLDAGYGDAENDNRDRTVQETMEAIRETLRERYAAWMEAREIAETDPTVNVGAGSAQYEVPEDMYAVDELEGPEEAEAAKKPEEVIDVKSEPTGNTQKVAQQKEKV